MPGGDEITIPYQPGMGPDSSAATATAAPDHGAGLETSSAPVDVPRYAETPYQNMPTPDQDVQFRQSWGGKVYHGILNALGGQYSTQFIPTENGVIQKEVKNTPGQQWKNIISGALSGFGAAAAGSGTGPGSTLRGAGLGVQAGYNQRMKQGEDEREAALKTATSNAQTALLTHQIAESTWRLANEQRKATDEIVTGANSFNQLVSEGGEGSKDLGTMSWEDAQKAAQEWPQLHHEVANGKIIAMPEIDPTTRQLTGKVHVAWVTNDWQNTKTTQDHDFTVPKLGKDGKTEYETVTIPKGAYTNGDLAKVIMGQGSEWAKNQLEQARIEQENKRTEQAGRIIPSEIAKNEAEAQRQRAEAAAADAKANGLGDVDWGPGGAKGFNSWHDKNVTPALQNERIYRLSSDIYNERKAAMDKGQKWDGAGAKSVQMLSNHIAGTFGNVKGARITKDLIEKHLGARSISDAGQVAIQRLVNGDQLSNQQWDAFFEMIGRNREESWRSVYDDAQALGRPHDYIAYPTDLRARWGMGPGRVPGSTGMMPAETARPAATPQATPQLKTSAQPPAGATHKAPGTDGKTYWTDDKGTPLGIVQQ